jgi:hypothetical protein
MKLRDLKMRKSGIVGRGAIRPLQTQRIIRRQQPNQTRNYNSCITWPQWSVTNVKAGVTHNQGQIKERVSRAAAWAPTYTGRSDAIRVIGIMVPVNSGFPRS